MLRITAPWISKRVTRKKLALAVFVLLAGAAAVFLYASQGTDLPPRGGAVPPAVHLHPEFITRAELKATAWQWIAAIVLSNVVVIGGMLWGGGSSYQRIANNSGRIKEAVVEKARDEVALEVRFDKEEDRRSSRDNRIQESIDDLSLQVRQVSSDLLLLSYKVEAISAVNFGYTDR